MVGEVAVPDAAVPVDVVVEFAGAVRGDVDSSVSCHIISKARTEYGERRTKNEG